MFVFSETYEFDWPVTVRLPAGGRHEMRRFTARFRLLPQARLAELAADARALLGAALVGWDGIVHEGGGAVQVTEGAKAALLDLPPVLVGLAEAYADALGGVERKN